MACFSGGGADRFHSNHSIMRTAYILAHFYADRLSLGSLFDDAGRSDIDRCVVAHRILARRRSFHPLGLLGVAMTVVCCAVILAGTILSACDWNELIGRAYY